MTEEQIKRAIHDFTVCVEKEEMNREYTKMEIEEKKRLLCNSYENFNPYNMIYKEEYGDKHKFFKIVAERLRQDSSTDPKEE